MMLKKGTIFVNSSYHISTLSLAHGGNEVLYAYTLYHMEDASAKRPIARWDWDAQTSRAIQYEDGEPRFVELAGPVELEYVMELARSFGGRVAQLPADMLGGVSQ